MMGRLNWILLACLTGLLLLDVFTIPKSASVREALPLFQAWGQGGVHTVQVSDPTMPASEQSLSLTRDEAGRFHIQEAFGYPARRMVLELLLNGIADLTTLDLLSDDAESHKRYGLLSEQGVRITFLDKDGGVLADLLQGNIAPGGKASYVRRLDGDEVFRAPSFIRRVRTDILPWIEGRWMPVEKSLIQRITIEHGDGSERLELSLQPGSRLQWLTADGEVISAAKMRTLQSALGRITVQAVVGSQKPDWVAATDALVFEVEQAGGFSWRGYLAPAGQGGKEGEASAGGANGGLDQDTFFALRLAPKACEALRRAVDRIAR